MLWHQNRNSSERSVGVYDLTPNTRFPVDSNRADLPLLVGIADAQSRGVGDGGQLAGGVVGVAGAELAYRSAHLNALVPGGDVAVPVVLEGGAAARVGDPGQPADAVFAGVVLVADEAAVGVKGALEAVQGVVLVDGGLVPGVGLGQDVACGIMGVGGTKNIYVLFFPLVLTVEES